MTSTPEKTREEAAQRAFLSALHRANAAAEALTAATKALDRRHAEWMAARNDSALARMARTSASIRKGGRPMSSMLPLHDEDRPLGEESMRLLFPDQDRAWECVRCGLCYSNAAKHADYYPQCVDRPARRYLMPPDLKPKAGDR